MTPHYEALAAMVEGAEKDGFTRGYLIAVAEIIHSHDEPVVAEDVLRPLGAKVADIKRLGITDHDGKVLRKLFREMTRKDAFYRKRSRAQAALSSNKSEK